MAAVADNVHPTSTEERGALPQPRQQTATASRSPAPSSRNKREAILEVATDLFRDDGAGERLAVPVCDWRGCGKAPRSSVEVG